MSPSLDIQNAMAQARSKPLVAPQAGGTQEATKKAAQEFESVFIAQFLGSMFEGIQTDGEFGGGQGEQMFRSMMLDNYSKEITSRGGFGIADAVTRSLAQRQQAQQLARAAAKGEDVGKPEAPATPVPVTPKKPAEFAAHPVAPASALTLTAKTAPVYAAHPATLFAASAAASAVRRSPTP